MAIKRAAAYLIDYVVISVPLMILCMMIGSFPVFETNGDFPFLMISFVFMPHIFWTNLISYPGHYGNLSWLPCIIAASVLFESLVYSLQERFRGATVGKKKMGLTIVSVDSSPLSFPRLFIRNIQKVLGKYLLTLPFLTCIFPPRKAVYDILTKTDVRKG